MSKVILIAADHLRDSAKGGVYEQTATRMAEGMRKLYLSNIPTDPKVISRKIARAAVCRRPKTRYLTGRGAKLMVFLHAVLPTRWWDAIVVNATTKM